MRLESDLHETRTNAEQSETAAEFRVTNESEPQRSADGRLMYFEHQLQPNADYSGVLECMSVEEARVLFEDMLDRFHLCDFYGFPLPPAGLPGFLHSGYSEEEPAGKLIAIGIKYALAVIRNQRRAMHLRWEEADDFIRKIHEQGENKVYEAQTAETMLEYERRDATPQFVYFIGSASGPIKIGIAVNPQNRLKGLQTGHHEKLTILATCDGDTELERAYHKRFAAHRRNGEWFERAPEILAEIERVANAPKGVRT